MGVPTDRTQLGQLDPNMLEPRDRLEFEQLLQWLRLSFLGTPLLVLLAFGAAGLTYALVISVAVVISFAWVGLLARYHPALLLRLQLWLRVVDCLVVYLVLVNYHAFLHNAYYDTVYALFVVAAAATHGRRGGWRLSAVAGLAVLVSRIQLMTSGAIPSEVRQLTDAIFYTLFFILTSSVVAFLMRKSAEVVLRREHAWNAELAAQNAELERTAQQLAEAIQLRDAMLAGVTHDLRTPLTVIKVQAQLLRRRTEPFDDRVRASLDHIERAAGRMAHWIDELLEVTRMRSVEDLELERAPTDLVQLVGEVLAEQQGGAPRHHLKLIGPCEPITGDWDADRLRRVFDNLVGNAIKYSPLGGQVTVELSAAQANGEAAWAQAVVRDQGLGIPPDDLPHIFKPFARGSNVAGHIGGTGMGLASAERIVVRHGGSLEVSSTLGQGSAFVLRLPLTRPPLGLTRDGDADRRPPSPSASPPSSWPRQEGSTSATTSSR